jgi:hypothetical protein
LPLTPIPKIFFHTKRKCGKEKKMWKCDFLLVAIVLDFTNYRATQDLLHKYYVDFFIISHPYMISEIRQKQIVVIFSVINLF